LIAGLAQPMLPSPSSAGGSAVWWEGMQTDNSITKHAFVRNNNPKIAHINPFFGGSIPP